MDALGGVQTTAQTVLWIAGQVRTDRSSDENPLWAVRSVSRCVGPDGGQMCRIMLVTILETDLGMGIWGWEQRETAAADRLAPCHSPHNPLHKQKPYTLALI